MARRHILPPQTTALERAVDTSMPAWDAIANAIEPVATTHSQAHKNWLAAHWQVAALQRYFDNTDALLTAALPWLRQRGSAAAVKRALSWIGLDTVNIEEDGPYLHIDPGVIVDTAAISRIVHLVRASIPLHVNFYRITHKWDLRMLRLDSGPVLDSGMLDNDSGVWVEFENGQEPIKVSQLQPIPAIGQAYIANPAVAHVLVRVLAVAQVPPLVQSVRGWQGQWDATPWMTTTPAEIKLLPA